MERFTKLFVMTSVASLVTFSGQISLGQSVSASQCKEGDYDCQTMEYSRIIAAECKGQKDDCWIIQYTNRLETDPKDGAAFLGRGRAIWMKDPERAVLDFRKAIEINPTYFQTYISLGILYCAVKNYDQAIIEFNRALNVAELERRDAGYRRIGYLRNAYVNRGFAYGQKRDFEKALADYNLAIKLGPNDDSGYSGRGAVYANQNDFERAIADYSKAIELDPTNWRSYYVRGHLYLKQGNSTRGNADINKSEELKKDQQDH